MTRSQQSILVTGGAGFIGSNFILHWLAQEGSRVVNLDKLTYAGNPANLAELSDDNRYVFARGDINDAEFGKRFTATPPAGGNHSFCGGKPCGPFHPQRAGIYPHEH